MKKFAAAIILFLYLAVSTGFVVSVHWCMNKVDSVALGDAHSNECSKCGMHMADNNGCCKNDVKLVKMTTDQKLQVVSVPDFSIALLPSAIYATDENFSFTKIVNTYPLANGPPISKQDTYLRNCVFRI